MDKDTAIQNAQAYQESMTPDGFASSGQAMDRQAVVESFEGFMQENGAQLPFTTILDIAETLMGILIKDAGTLAAIKSIIGIIRRFLPTPTE